MEKVIVIEISCSCQERVVFLVEIYGDVNIDDLIVVIECICKCLGGL